eukprot:CAMPEP_0185731380 /NCGR_PEP_ID=MMETSP1171-20130828/12762_1 /TAXON_ID=374046 /ORGANISM="Helicotheca tamensis, Strain CCMP826" /LENGTH=385 /DNA_ID=CAMNT_0028400639 /DNA_START=44 /DNA_END=1202 /DNA_ORIENTATION=+
MKRTRCRLPVLAASALILATLMLLPTALPCAVVDGDTQYVIHIVMDGLRPAAVAKHLDILPNFQRLRAEGAFTDNARTEYLETQTTPTHFSMYTGLPIEKHGYWRDEDIGGKYPKLAYKESIFDLVTENGMRSCLFTGKDKFAIFERSFQMSYYKYFKKREDVPKTFISEMKKQPCHFSFVHLIDPDSMGHKYKGAATTFNGKVPYDEAVKTVDKYLGQIFNLVETNSTYAGKTLIIATADHGFADVGNHAKTDLIDNHKIPFYVWGPCVAPGADLYDLNIGNRKDPGDTRTHSYEGIQPIRNREVGPLAADALGITSTKGAFGQQDTRFYIGTGSCRGVCDESGNGTDTGGGDEGSGTDTGGGDEDTDSDTSDDGTDSAAAVHP